MGKLETGLSTPEDRAVYDGRQGCLRLETMPSPRCQNSRVTSTVFRVRRSTLIRLARSNAARARRFVSRLTPISRSFLFGSSNVLVCFFHAKCINQMHTSAFGVRVALQACSAHQIG